MLEEAYSIAQDNVSLIEYVLSCLVVLRVTLFQLEIQPKYTFKLERFF